MLPPLLVCSAIANYANESANNANVLSGKCCGYAALREVRRHNADALGVGKAVDVEHKLACSEVLVGKLACSNVASELGSNEELELHSSLIQEPGKPEHKMELERHSMELEQQRKQVLEQHSKLELVHRLVPEHKQELEHKQVPVRKLEPEHKLALGKLEHKQVLELGSTLALELGSILALVLGSSLALEHKLCEPSALKAIRS